MDKTHDSPASVVLTSVVAGMLGAFAVSVMVALGRTVMAGADKPREPMDDAGISAGEALSDGPAMPPDMNRVTATFVQKIATGIFGSSLDTRQQYFAGTAWHLTYGGFWGMLYALLQSSVHIPALLLGPLWEVGVWAVGPGWLVPKMKLMLPPGKQRPQLTGMVVGVHAAMAASLPSCSTRSATERWSAHECIHDQCDGERRLSYRRRIYVRHGHRMQLPDDHGLRLSALSHR